MSRLHSFEKYKLDELTETIQTVITPSMIGGRNPASPRVVGYNGSNYILFEARSPPSSSSSSVQIWMGNIEKDFSVSGIEPLITSYTGTALYSVMFNTIRGEWWVFVSDSDVSPVQTDLWVYTQDWTFKGRYTNIFSGVSNINVDTWFTPAPFMYNYGQEVMGDVMGPNNNFAIIKLTDVSVLPPKTSSSAYSFTVPWSVGTGNYVQEEDYGVRVMEALVPNAYTIKPFFDMYLDPETYSGGGGGPFGTTIQNVPAPYLVPLFPHQDLIMGFLQTCMYEAPVHPYVTPVPNGRRYNLFFIDWQQTPNYNPLHSEIKVVPVPPDVFKTKSYRKLIGTPAYGSNLTANPYYTGLILTHGARALNIYLNASVNGTLSIYEYPDAMDFLSGAFGTANPTNASYTSGSGQTVVVDNPSGAIDLSFSPASTPYNLYIWAEVMI